MIKIKYRIEYLFNIDDPTRVNIIQYKNLISHENYLNDIKPKYQEIYDLEILLSQMSEKKKKKSIEAKNYSDKIKEIKGYIKETYGDFWFTDKSLLAEAIVTGVIRYPDELKEKFEYLRKNIKVKLTKEND